MWPRRKSGSRSRRLGVFNISDRRGGDLAQDFLSDLCIQYPSVLHVSVGLRERERKEYQVMWERGQKTTISYLMAGPQKDQNNDFFLCQDTKTTAKTYRDNQSGRAKAEHRRWNIQEPQPSSLSNVAHSEHRQCYSYTKPDYTHLLCLTQPWVDDEFTSSARHRGKTHAYM